MLFSLLFALFCPEDKFPDHIVSYRLSYNLCTVTCVADIYFLFTKICIYFFTYLCPYR